MLVDRVLGNEEKERKMIYKNNLKNNFNWNLRSLTLGKRSQIWVETAIYTLIGLTIIAIVFSVATPQIQRIKDRGVITQTGESLLLLNSEIIEAADVNGNVRIVQFQITKGFLDIDAISNSITYTLENSNVKFSEPGESVIGGDLTYLTEEYGKRFNILLTLNYDEYEILFNGNDEQKILNAGGVPYKIRIENLGVDDINDKIRLDFSVV